MVKLFVLMLYIPVNNFSVMTGCFPIAWFEPVLCREYSVMLKDTMHAPSESQTSDPLISSLPLSHHAPHSTSVDRLTRPQSYKTLFILNSAEHKIYPANKC